MSRLSNFGQNPGRLGRFGQGRQASGRPEPVPVDFKDFSGGYDARLRRDGSPANGSPSMVNIQLTEAGHLRRFPGTTLLESMGARDPRQVIIHRALSGWTELIMFDPPYIGVRRDGATVWTDIGLLKENQRFVHVIHGEHLIFHNGAGDVHYKIAGEAPVVADTVPHGFTFATFAARLYIAGVDLNGDRQPMGLIWSDVSSDPLSYDVNLGAGEEILLDDPGSGDSIVALRTMGLDFMAILCRNSIWVAKFTGVATRPGDFQPRAVGGGCAAEATARNTPWGVMYLSYDGVRVFDGNESKIISQQINPDLLPLTDIGEPWEFGYSAFFNLAANQYWLLTPDETWVFDLNKRYWTRLDKVITGGTLFAEQIAGTPWSAFTGTTWAEHSGETWQDYADRETGDLGIVMLGNVSGAVELHEPDETSDTFLGQDYIGRWDTPIVRDKWLHLLTEHNYINLEYEGSGDVRFALPNIRSLYEPVTQRTLQAASEALIDQFSILHTGQGSGLRLDILGRQTIVRQMQLLVTPTSRKIPTTVAAPVALPATNVAADGFRANWEAASGAIAYRLYIAEDDDFINTLPGYNGVEVSGLFEDVSGLDPDSDYFYRITAIGGAAAGIFSNTITVETGQAATGGTETEVEIAGQMYRIHEFLASGDLTVHAAITVRRLMVAGGGCGGQWTVGRAGGGGGGGVDDDSGIALAPGVYPVVVGAGGVFSGSTPQNGSNSSFNGETVLGGGRGGWSSVLDGAVGGCGGGGRSSDGGTQGDGALGTAGQGEEGGDGTSFSGAGGGGGASKKGGNGNSASSDGTPARDGGAGRESDIYGAPQTFGGGGGGCGRTAIGQNGGVGGAGGGGNGSGAQGQGSAGQAGTGGGGGGTTNNLPNAVGGSGRVVIRYPIAA